MYQDSSIQQEIPIPLQQNDRQKSKETRKNKIPWNNPVQTYSSCRGIKKALSSKLSLKPRKKNPEKILGM